MGEKSKPVPIRPTALDVKAKLSGLSWHPLANKRMTAKTLYDNDGAKFRNA
ncbi:hypothetical protein JNB91_11210 [Rhizobium wenxiniae]|uniref:hypothetical protein n=1 Tax=Rhizobium wenxiniae TaxID=1737357 RepID=UPI001C6E746E|nr:hypothetical protein [Rhizobium wenxiniae]MBW9088412.1 hypothetical protein [Rhizobium wenxiniae]